VLEQTLKHYLIMFVNTGIHALTSNIYLDILHVLQHLIIKVTALLLQGRICIPVNMFTLNEQTIVRSQHDCLLNFFIDNNIIHINSLRFILHLLFQSNNTSITN